MTDPIRMLEQIRDEMRAKGVPGWPNGIDAALTALSERDGRVRDEAARIVREEPIGGPGKHGDEWFKGWGEGVRMAREQLAEAIEAGPQPEEGGER